MDVEKKNNAVLINRRKKNWVSIITVFCWEKNTVWGDAAQLWGTESITSLRRTSKVIKISISPSPLASRAPQISMRDICLPGAAMEMNGRAEVRNLEFQVLEYICLFS